MVALASPLAAASWESETPPTPAKHDQTEECQEEAARLPNWAWAGFIGLGTIGIGGTAFALRTLWWSPSRRWAAPMAGTGFFARLSRRDVENHPARARVLEAVASHPGIPAAQLAELVGINVGTLDYHLSVLERDGRLHAVRAGRDRLFFLAGPIIDEAGLAVLAAPGRGAVAEAIKHEPGLHTAAIAERLGLQPPTVHHHLKILEEAGFVRVERGTRSRCYPTDKLNIAQVPPRRRRVAVKFDEDQKNT